MNKSRGFTIVELLIVIVVIGILATITIVAYNGVKQRAQIVAISDGLRKVDKSMRLWMLQSGASSWPTEPTYYGGTNLSAMIADNPELRNVLQTVPSVVGIDTDEWFYDNDVDLMTSSACGNPYHGVNIVLGNLTNPAIAAGVDKTIDDGNGDCGIVKYEPISKKLFYSLSYNYADIGNN